jgi:hypothetical protein
MPKLQTSRIISNAGMQKMTIDPFGRNVSKDSCGRSVSNAL